MGSKEDFSGLYTLTDEQIERGDVNLDGSLEVGGYTETEEGETVALPGLDYVYIQNYLAKLVSLNNAQLFLADIDKNGYVDLFDALLINQFAENKYF